MFKWPVVAAIKSQFSGPTTTPHGSRYSRSRVALSESGNCRPRRDSGSGVAPVRPHWQGGPDQIYERIKLITQNTYRASGSVNLTSFLGHEQGCRPRGTPRDACSVSYTALPLKLKSRPMSLLDAPPNGRLQRWTGWRCTRRAMTEFFQDCVSSPRQPCESSTRVMLRKRRLQSNRGCRAEQLRQTVP